MNSSKDFIEGMNNSSLCMIIGAKKSGKSFTLCRYLRYCFAKNLYDKYILVPCFLYEQTKL